MELYQHNSKSPVVRFQSGESQAGHLMWLSGDPFVSWNCNGDCNHRIRSPLDENHCICEQCGTVYQINQGSSGIDITEADKRH